MNNANTSNGRFTEVDGLKLHYREAGVGDPVLLLHGWPTSSFLWRNIIPEIAKTNRVIALDLPGFGLSDKPLDKPYSFRFFSRILDGFLKNLAIKSTSLAVHDLGGPIGLFWAVNNAARIEKLAILNTIVYPEMSWAVVLFVLSLRLPFIRGMLATPAGLRMAMRIGVTDATRRTEEMMEGTLAPFESESARQALIRAGIGLNAKGFAIISGRLKHLKMPVRVIYGEDDRILPDIAKTVTRIETDLPHARITALPKCGHFLQEDRPEEVSKILASFFGES